MEDGSSSPLPLIPVYDELLTEKGLSAVSLLHDHVFPAEASCRFADFKSTAADYPSTLGELENVNAKRKFENDQGLFCVMRKKNCLRFVKSSDHNFPGLINAETSAGYDLENCLRHDHIGSGSGIILEDHSIDLQDMDMVRDCVSRHICVGDIAGNVFLVNTSCFSMDESMDDTTECFDDVISETAFKVRNAIGEDFTSPKPLSLRNFLKFNEDERNVMTASSSEVQNPISTSFYNRVTEEETLRPKDVGLITSEICLRGASSIASLPDEYIIGTQLRSNHGSCDYFLHSQQDTRSPSHVLELFEENVKCTPSREDPEIPCKSSLIKVNYANVVNMSMEKGSIDHELNASNKYDEPTPTSIVPPVGELTSQPDTWLFHQMVSSRNGYEVNDDELGPAISATPCYDTLEGPNECPCMYGFLTSERKLLLLEDKPGSSSSMNMQLPSNVSTCKDTEPIQNPSGVHKEEFDGDDEVSFPDIDAMIQRMNLFPDDDSFLKEWVSQRPREPLFSLEHCIKASMRRAISSQGSFALLYGRDSKYYITKPEVILGRSSVDINVDIDLGKEGYGNVVSRRQAMMKLEKYGSFSLKNLGKAQIRVNGKELKTGGIITLTSTSSIDIRGITLVFKINKEAVRRFLMKNQGNNEGTKFGWSENIL